MIQAIPAVEVVSAVRSAAHSVFSTMLSLPLEDHEPYEKTETDPPENVDGVEALVGIAGAWSGMGRISCTPQFACQMADALLMAEHTAMSEDVLDAVAEVANMIIGNVKTHFEDILGPLELGIPMVIFGRHYKTRSMGAPSWVVVPFDSSGCLWEIRFCLMPSRTRSSSAHSPMLQAP